MRLFTCVSAVLLVSTTAFAQGHRKAPTLTTEDVGRPLGYEEFTPTAINNKGEVVGVGRRPDDEFGYREDAFVWSRRAGFALIATDAVAQDINDRGDVAVAHWVCYSDESRCHYCRGSIWSRGSEVMDLGAMYPLALNNRGDVAGHCPGPFPGGSPIVWDGSACAFRGGIFEQWSCQGDEYEEYCGQIATGINERSDIVGQRFTNFASGSSRGQSWAVIFPMEGGEVVLDRGTNALGINNRGTIIGQQYADGSLAAIVWTRSGLQRLPATGWSEATAINSRGWIVGGNRLWKSPTASPIPLDGGATDLNDRGQIVGVIGSFPHEVVIWTAKP